MLFTYEKTIYKTIHKQTIFAQVWYNDMIRYKVKFKQTTLQYKGRKWVSKAVSVWRDVDPVEAPKLFEMHPYGFSGYVSACIRESMLDQVSL